MPCTICNRTFKPESLKKHITICEKNANKKRKTFDSSKQRIQGTELEEFPPVVLKKVEKSPVRKSQSSWKEKHLEFVRAIRQARGINEVPGKRSLRSAVAQTRPANHEKCPHCERNFGPKAFDRHMEWCKEQKARIPKSPASIIAKERLEARTKVNIENSFFNVVMIFKMLFERKQIMYELCMFICGMGSHLD